MHTKQVMNIYSTDNSRPFFQDLNDIRCSKIWEVIYTLSASILIYLLTSFKTYLLGIKYDMQYKYTE